MQEEKGARKTSRFDPSMDSHRPASGKSQDISHVLASTFKDLYTKDVMGKDTLSNLIKTKTGQGGFHDRYVEELQQVSWQLMLHNFPARFTSQQRKSHSVYEICHLFLNPAVTLGTRARPDQTITRPNGKDEPSAEDRAEGRKKLPQLKDRNNFLCNPRFLPLNAQQGGASLIHPRAKGGKMEHVKKGAQKQGYLEEKQGIDINIQYVLAGRFPGKGGVVAPGLSCKYTVCFTPDSFGDYEDYIVVETAGRPFMVPIAAKRPAPILTLPRVLDCGCCLIGGVTFVEFPCQNVSLSAGSFCIIPKNQWPASNLRVKIKLTHYLKITATVLDPIFIKRYPAFRFFSSFSLYSLCQVFTIVCDNCQVKDISIEDTLSIVCVTFPGEGQQIAFELVSVSGKKEPPVVGEVHDLTAEHFVRFSPCNPHSVQQKRLIIRNNVHLDLPFHWQIMTPNLHPFLPGEIPEPSHIQFHLAADDVFHVSPITGVLTPFQDQEFLFTFCPKEVQKTTNTYNRKQYCLEATS
uniref:DLEC1 cilia and flagella associated protein n=1 Tax=Cyclopterus lumpus TaxID=8103 RepID=A0A8C3AH22_CYCLU